MARTDVAAAANLTVEPVPIYHPDAHQLGRGRALASDLLGSLLGRSGQHVFTPTAEYHGYVQNPQRFVGVAGLGNPRVVSPRSSVLSDERAASPLNAAAEQVWLERMKRARS